jgi:hypothetical protein
MTHRFFPLFRRQEQLHDGNEVYASTVQELGLSVSGLHPHLRSPEVRRTPDGFVASVILQLKNGTSQRRLIRQDSRVWKEGLH